jgi:hypothetical protein
VKRAHVGRGPERERETFLETPEAESYSHFLFCCGCGWWRRAFVVTKQLEKGADFFLGTVRTGFRQ